MTDDASTGMRFENLADRVERGEFDAALRPESTQQALSEGPERYFGFIAEVARAQFDPVEQWDDFVAALWEQVDAGFGLTADEDDGGRPRPWFDFPDDPSFVAWDQRERDSSER